MKVGYIKWCDLAEEGKIKFTQEFEDSYKVLKLDCLQDLIYILENKYNDLLSSQKNYD